MLEAEKSGGVSPSQRGECNRPAAWPDLTHFVPPACFLAELDKCRKLILEGRSIVRVIIVLYLVLPVVHKVNRA